MMRVATKYPRTASTWFESRGQAVEVVRLHGSDELAPQVGLVDGIVDLTATGRTLRDNRLRIAAGFGSSSGTVLFTQLPPKTHIDCAASAGAKNRSANDGAGHID